MQNTLFQGKKITKRVLTLQNKKQATAYVYILLTLLTVSFFGFFALRPAFSIIAGLQKQLADNKVVLEALTDKLSALVNLDKEYKQIEPSLEIVYEAIPTNAQAAPLIRQVEKLAQTNNMTINSLTTGKIDDYPIDSNNTMYSFTFTINTIGSESSIQTFLSSLIKFNRAIGISRVITDKTESGTVEATIEGIAYFLPNPK